MNNNMSKYAIYELNKLHPQIFGETYVVVTGTMLEKNEYLAEYFTLTSRPNENLRCGSLSISGRSVPEELLTIDIDFAMEEALHSAKNDFSLLLELRAAELQRPEFEYLPFEFKPRPSPFVSCRMRGRFDTQLMTIKDQTKCPTLANYLLLLKQVQKSR